jgi:hypothetical protein
MEPELYLQYWKEHAASELYPVLDKSVRRLRLLFS